MRPVRIPQRWQWSASALFVLGSYLLVALHSLTLPAIYLDEINPDYLAVRMLTPNSHTDAWIPPAKYFADRFLLLTNPYSGALHGYLQVPFFYFLGGSIESFRISHVFLGILVLSAFYASVATITRSVLISTLSSLILVVDPAFVFAFRTQGFQQLFPTFFTLLGILLCCKGEARPRRMIAAGMCFGLSVWGYFIFGFLVPGLLLAVFLQERPRRWQRAFALTAGIILGYLPTVFGYIDAFLAFGSWPHVLEWVRGTVSGMQRTYHPSGVNGLMGVLASNVAGVAQHLWILLTSEWIWQVMFGLLHKDHGQYLKAAVLLLLPVSAFLYQKLNRPADRVVHNALLMSLLAIWSYLLVCVMFGGLLLSHHYHPILILSYFAAAIGSAAFLSSTTYRKAWILVPAMALIVTNATQDRSVFRELHDLGGRSYYSHVVTDYAIEEAHGNDKSDHVFMDWGGMLQFIYLTEGRVPTHDVRLLTTWGQTPLAEALCGLGAAKLVFIGNDADTRAPEYVLSQHLPVQSMRSLKDERENFEYVIIQTQPAKEICEPAFSAPGFEDGTLTSWTPYGDVQASVDHEAAHTGQFGLEEKGGNGSVWQDVIGLQPGNIYTISAWVAAAPDSESIARIGVFNPATGETSFSQEWKPGKAWQKVSYSVRMGEGNKLKIHLWRQPGKGTVYWDDVQFSKQ